MAYRTIYKFKVIFWILVLLSIRCSSFSYGNATDDGAKEDFIQSWNISGYYEDNNKEITKGNYNDSYRYFDEFIAAFYQNRDFHQFILKIDNAFSTSTNIRPFANAPMGLRYFLNHSKDKKTFFHYSKEYHEFILTNYKQELDRYPIFSQLLDNLQQIDDYSRQKFIKYIKILQKKHKNIVDVIYKDRNDLTIITKVVHYSSSPKMASSPHFDFSALTLMLDNDDQNDDNLIISPYSANFEHQSFSQIKRRYQRTNSGTSEIFIPGLALRLSGIDIPPTPHAVKSLNSSRHSMISFAMVPYLQIDYDQIKVGNAK